MKRKLYKILSLFIAIFMLVSMPIITFANSKIIVSIGSLNMEDDGITIGIDKTQNKSTSYSESIENDGEENTLVYVSQASTFGVFIPKTIVLSGQDKNANYLVRVSGNIGGMETINVIPDKTFNLSQYGKKDIVANITQDKEFWFFDEIDISGNGTIIAEKMTAGSWNGKFNFNISLGGSIIVEAKDINGNDLAASASEIMGEEKSTLLDSLVSTGMIKSKNDVKALINVETNEFENFANTTFNVNSIAQEGDKIVILHFDESKQEWEYISTETVDNEGKISANFTSFSPVAFVKITNDEIYENIEIPGLYDASGYLLCTWEESGINAEMDYGYYSSDNNYFVTAPTSGYYVTTTKYPTTTKIIFPNNVTKIGMYAFKRCPNITTIKLSNSIKEIKKEGFEGCAKITNVTIPGSISKLGESAFSQCKALTTIVFENGVSSLGPGAFSNCDNITNIKMPISMTQIGSWAFNGSKNLNTIYYAGTQAQWNTVSKSSGWNNANNLTIIYNYQ